MFTATLFTSRRIGRRDPAIEGITAQLYPQGLRLPEGDLHEVAPGVVVDQVDRFWPCVVILSSTEGIKKGVGAMVKAADGTQASREQSY